MEASVKFFCIVGLIVLLSITTLNGANAAGVCPRSTPDNEAMKLIPCASAAQDSNAANPNACALFCCPIWLRVPLSNLKLPSPFPSVVTLTGPSVTSVELIHCH
ncbi:hypothetical protein Pfo_029187, partial [Paulownia fortunei]